MLLFAHPARGILRRPLRTFWKELSAEILSGVDADCLIADDAELTRLNGRFRGRKYATDVLSFPPSDIAISFDRARVQASELGHSPGDELRILMLHGLLHLSGMDHETDGGEMARAERRWRRKLGLPVGLIERSS